MATGSILLLPSAANPPDGSASNAGPKLLSVKGSNTAPGRQFFYGSFDPTTQQHLWWVWTMPANYASGGLLRIMWAANATTNAVMWGASIGVQASGNADSYLAHAQAAASTVTTTILGTTARRVQESQITLGALDSLAANALVALVVYRVAANAADTLAVDAELLSINFDYTTT